MKERPILFKGDLVRAILEGRKTQTRRVVKQRVSDGNSFNGEFKKHSPLVMSKDGWLKPTEAGACPFGVPGDRLWVRETWAYVPWSAYVSSVGVKATTDPSRPDMAAVYKAGWDRVEPKPWKPSIHMPRWASRITLEVTDVRVERLKEMGHADAQKEGMGVGALAKFKKTWDSIYAKQGLGWSDNPWVWVVDFKMLEPERGKG